MLALRFSTRPFPKTFLDFCNINHRLSRVYQYISGCPKLNLVTITRIHAVVKDRIWGIIFDSSPSHTAHTYLVIKPCQYSKMDYHVLHTSSSSMPVWFQVFVTFSQLPSSSSCILSWFIQVSSVHCFIWSVDVTITRLSNHFMFFSLPKDKLLIINDIPPEIHLKLWVTFSSVCTIFVLQNHRWHTIGAKYSFVE